MDRYGVQQFIQNMFGQKSNSTAQVSELAAYMQIGCLTQCVDGIRQI